MRLTGLDDGTMEDRKMAAPVRGKAHRACLLYACPQFFAVI